MCITLYGDSKFDSMAYRIILYVKTLKGRNTGEMNRMGYICQGRNHDHRVIMMFVQLSYIEKGGVSKGEVVSGLGD